MIYALMLIPVAALGAFTVMLFEIPPQWPWEAIIVYGVMGSGYAFTIGLLAWMRNRQGYFLGFSWVTWMVLVLIAYFAGVGCSLLVQFA